MDFRPNPMAVGVCLFGFFVFYVNFVVLEVIGVPLCQQQLGAKNTSTILIWSVTDFSMLDQVGQKVNLCRRLVFLWPAVLWVLILCIAFKLWLYSITILYKVFLYRPPWTDFWPRFFPSFALLWLVLSPKRWTRGDLIWTKGFSSNVPIIVIWRPLSYVSGWFISFLGFSPCS